MRQRRRGWLTNIHKSKWKRNMFKKLSMFGACLLLAASGAMVSTPAHAAGNWYFISYCSQPVFCWDPQVEQWGPFSSEQNCYNFRSALSQTYPYSNWIYTLTMCWEE
jgi:hypothetical protein